MDSNSTVCGNCNLKFGIYRWRKKCIYSLLFALIVVTVIVNLIFTLWMLKIMQFSSKGMGPLTITVNGIKLDGAAFILDDLISSRINSRSGNAILLESDKNLTLKTNSKSFLNSQINLGKDNIECRTKTFSFSNDKGQKIFSVNSTKLLVNAEKLKITGEGGTKFEGSVQTRMLLAQLGHDLSLDSPTNSLRLHSAKDIVIDSTGGRIEAHAPYNINLRSEPGAIHVESSSVLMPKLKMAKSSRFHAAHNSGVYQVCVCENGKMFLAAPDSVCSSQNDNNICR